MCVCGCGGVCVCYVCVYVCDEWMRGCFVGEGYAHTYLHAGHCITVQCAQCVETYTHCTSPARILLRGPTSLQTSPATHTSTQPTRTHTHTHTQHALPSPPSAHHRTLHRVTIAWHALLQAKAFLCSASFLLGIECERKVDCGGSEEVATFCIMKVYTILCINESSSRFRS